MLDHKKQNSVSPKIHLGKNLSYLMDKEKLDAKALNFHVRIGTSTINEIRRGTRSPNVSTMIEISHFFNISIDDLLYRDLTEVDPKSLRVKIPVYDFESTLLLQKDMALDYISVDSDHFDVTHCFAVKLNNNALTPLFDKGTYFVVSPNEKPRDGDIVLVHFNQNIPCLRRIYLEDKEYFGHIEIRTNPEIKTYREYKVLGVVIKAIQNLI